jgi:hypothetical protein
VEYGSDDFGWLRTPTSTPQAAHTVPIVRLRPDTEYQARAFVLDPAGCPSAVETTQFNTGSLPEQLGSFSVQSRGQASFPLFLMDWRITLPFTPRNTADNSARTFVVLDQDGQVVWYYLLPRRVDTSNSFITLIRLANGNFLYLAREYGMEEISPDARSVRRFTIPRLDTAPHHDLIQLPDGRVLFLGGEERRIEDDSAGSSRSDVRLRGDTLHLLDLETGEAEQVWSAFDVLDPNVRLDQWRRMTEDGKDDWLHTNSVSLGPRGNVILSFRYLDQVISLSPDLKSIEWRLGGPGGSFDFPNPSDRFYGQHSAYELPDNRILLFDNGNYRPEGDYSRGVELDLNFQTMTARKVWEYRHQPDLYSSRVSNLWRLPNGSTLLNFGFREDPSAPILAVEARPDGTAAFEQYLTLDGTRASRYRVYPLTSLAGEQPVQPPARGGQ